MAGNKRAFTPVFDGLCPRLSGSSSAGRFGVKSITWGDAPLAAITSEYSAGPPKPGAFGLRDSSAECPSAAAETEIRVKSDVDYARSESMAAFQPIRLNRTAVGYARP